MTTLVRVKEQFDLCEIPRTDLLDELKAKISGRCNSAFLFGSYANQSHSPGSDLDLVLVVETQTKFTERAIAFKDLLDVFPRVDILVYTPEEFARLTAQPDGFGASLERTKIRII